MEHIVNLSFGIDDSDIEKRVKDKILDETTKKVRDNLLKKSNYWGEGDNTIEKIARQEIEKIIQENKQDIINAATDRLYQYIVRSNKVPKKLESDKE